MSFLMSSLRRQLLGAFTLVTAIYVIALLIGYSGVGSIHSKVQAAAKQQAVLAQATGDARDIEVSQAQTVLDPGARRTTPPT